MESISVSSDSFSVCLQVELGAGARQGNKVVAPYSRFDPVIFIHDSENT